MYEIVKLIIAALAGGGLWQLITWRIRKKKLETDTAANEFKQFEDILDSYINRMSRMADDIIKLQEENLRLRQNLMSQIEKSKNNDSNTAHEHSSKAP